MENKCILILEKEYYDLKDQIKKLKDAKELKGTLTITSSYRDSYYYPEIYVDQNCQGNLKLSDGNLSKIRKILKHYVEESYQKGLICGQSNPSEKTKDKIKSDDVIKLCNFMEKQSIWSLYILKKMLKKTWGSGVVIIKNLIFDEQIKK